MSQAELQQIAHIEPIYLVKYLQRLGWKVVDSIGDDIAVLKTGMAGRIPVPLSRDFEDYSLRVREALAFASEQFHLGFPKLIKDLLNPPSDFIQIHLDCPSHSLGIAEAASFYEGVHDLCKVAVMQKSHPRRFHRSLKGASVDKIDTAWRVLPAQLGSYEVTVACPLDSLKPAEQARAELQLYFPFAHADTPSESRATLELLDSGLATLLDASHSSNSLEDLLRVEQPNISYNLCETILTLQPKAAQAPLEIEIEWSGELPKQKGPKRLFEKRELDFVESLAELLMPPEERSPQVNLIGIISSLHGARNAAGLIEGEIALSTHDTSGKPMSVRTYLDPNQHAVALRAYGEGRHFSIEGTLVRKPRQNRLEEPFNARVI